jgi:hypothetical protein
MKEVFGPYAKNITCGENIYFKSTKAIVRTSGNGPVPLDAPKQKLRKIENGTIPCKAWYSESAHYNFTTNRSTNKSLMIGKIKLH